MRTRINRSPGRDIAVASAHGKYTQLCFKVRQGTSTGERSYKSGQLPSDSSWTGFTNSMLIRLLHRRDTPTTGASQTKTAGGIASMCPTAFSCQQVARTATSNRTLVFWTESTAISASPTISQSIQALLARAWPFGMSLRHRRKVFATESTKSHSNAEAIIRAQKIVVQSNLVAERSACL